MCISYIDDIANKEMVESIRKGLEKIKIDGLPMADKTVEKYIFGQHLNHKAMFLFLLMAHQIIAAWLGGTGFMVAITIWTIFLIILRPAGVPYLWPFIPFSYSGLGDIFKRKPIPLKKIRPAALRPIDSDKYPDE